MLNIITYLKDPGNRSNDFGHFGMSAFLIFMFIGVSTTPELQIEVPVTFLRWVGPVFGLLHELWNVRKEGRFKWDNLSDLASFAITYSFFPFNPLVLLGFLLVYWLGIELKTRFDPKE